MKSKTCHNLARSKFREPLNPTLKSKSEEEGKKERQAQMHKNLDKGNFWNERNSIRWKPYHGLTKLALLFIINFDDELIFKIS
jgi:hypothetical protein